jgi:chorismate mutase
VIRVLMHFHTDRSLDEVVHVYLDGAESLRDDVER